MNPERVKKILIIKFFGIGSLVLAEPFFRAARKLFPNAEIHLLTLASNAEVMEMIPGVDRVRFVDLGGNLFHAVAAYISTLVTALRGGYDTVLDMEFYTRASAVVSLATLARVRIGYHAQGIYRGDIQSHRVPFNAYWHVSNNFLSLLEPFGQDVNTSVSVPQLDIPKTLDTDASTLLDQLGELDARFIVINVNAGELAYERRWFGERFATLAARLSKEYSLHCIFIGAPGEHDYVEVVVRDTQTQGGRAVNAAGELSLRAMAQVSALSQLVISNDSGPLHVAAASGAKVVGFFGPETPVLYGPAGVGHLVFHQPLACSPCINIEQGKRIQCRYATPLCQDATSVEAAFAAISSQFGEQLGVKGEVAADC